MVDLTFESQIPDNSVNNLLKNAVAGISTLLVLSPSARIEGLDIDDYLHESAKEAVQSDWIRVGGDLMKSATEENIRSERVEQTS